MVLALDYPGAAVHSVVDGETLTEKLDAIDEGLQCARVVDEWLQG